MPTRESQELPMSLKTAGDPLYTAAQVRELDRRAIEEQGIDGYLLMQRAGQAVFDCLRERWPGARRLLLLCGAGNNAGDAYVVARLARQAGLDCQLLSLVEPARLKGDAALARAAWMQAGGSVESYTRLPEGFDLLVDGILGTGLERPVEGRWAELIAAANAYPAPALALDVPSGLNADSGRVMGCALKADATISFIGRKRGLYTGQGPELAGERLFDDLQVPTGIYQGMESEVRRCDWPMLAPRLPARPRSAHKGDFGRLLIIGGDHGYTGALRLAGEAALRSGAGLVTLATRQAHAALVNIGRPELMCRGVEKAGELRKLVRQCDALVIGPGLGQGDWGTRMLGEVLQWDRPMLLDADALNLLAKEPESRGNWLLTPHPGEAARLLGSSVAEVEADRFAAVRKLTGLYGGSCLLKGAGSLVADGQQVIHLCSDGNPGMASGGMGDLLSGICGTFMAQGMSAVDAALHGACLHAAAGDLAARDGEKGLLASDLLPGVRRLLNGLEGTCCS